MFKLIDVYILRKFLTTFIYIVLILVTVVCLIDFVEKNGDWIKNDLSVGFVVSNYYLYFFPYVANMVSPLMVFISVVYVMARMASHSEIVAILASGTSFRRILAPLLVGSVLLGVIIFYVTGWVIPKSNEKRIAFEEAYVYTNRNFDDYNFHVGTSPGVYAYLESYNLAINEGYQFTLETIKDQKLHSKLKAKRIRWDGKKQQWTLYSWQLQKFDGMEEVITRGNSLDTSINLYPSDFNDKKAIHEIYTLPELVEQIDEMNMRGMPGVDAFRVHYFERFAYPFAIIILTLMGAIVSGRKSREGTGFQIALGFVLAFAFIILVIIGRSLGKSGSLDPIVGAWFPNIIFAGVTFFLFRKMPK